MALVRWAGPDGRYYVVGLRYHITFKADDDLEQALTFFREFRKRHMPAPRVRTVIRAKRKIVVDSIHDTDAVAIYKAAQQYRGSLVPTEQLNFGPAGVP